MHHCLISLDSTWTQCKKCRQARLSIGALQAQYGSAAVKQRPAHSQDVHVDPNSIPVDVNAIPLGTRTAGKPPAEPVPEVEWWDRALLPGDKGEQQYAVSMSEEGLEVGCCLFSVLCHSRMCALYISIRVMLFRHSRSCAACQWGADV